MKKIYSSFLLIVLFVGSAFCQITINTADLPAAGDTFRVSNGQAFTGMDATITGPNHTWDYSQLSSNSQMVDTFLSINNTNVLYSVIFINFPLNNNRCNVATLGQSFSLGTVSVNNVYNFYYNSSASYTQKGFGAGVNNVPLPITYSPFDVIYNFPMNFGNEDSCASGYVVDLTSTLGLYYSVNRKRHNWVDGWGSLTTPFGTFNTLRVKTSIWERDSVYIDSLHFGLNLPAITTYEYKWLGTGQGIPLLQINTSAIGTISSIVYRDSMLSNIGISSPDLVTADIHVYPNPASKELFVEYKLAKACSFSMELFSLKGDLVYNSIPVKQEGGNHVEILDIRKMSLAGGTYLIRMNIGSSRFIRQVVIGE